MILPYSDRTILPAILRNYPASYEIPGNHSKIGRPPHPNSSVWNRLALNMILYFFGSCGLH